MKYKYNEFLKSIGLSREEFWETIGDRNIQDYECVERGFYTFTNQYWGQKRIDNHIDETHSNWNLSWPLEVHLYSKWKDKFKQFGLEEVYFVYVEHGERENTYVFDNYDEAKEYLQSFEGDSLLLPSKLGEIINNLLLHNDDKVEVIYDFDDEIKEVVFIPGYYHKGEFKRFNDAYTGLGGAYSYEEIGEEKMLQKILSAKNAFKRNFNGWEIETLHWHDKGWFPDDLHLHLTLKKDGYVSEEIELYKQELKNARANLNDIEEIIEKTINFDYLEEEMLKGQTQGREL